MSSVVFGKARVTSDEVMCGFIPESIVSMMQSSNGSHHVEAAQTLLDLVNKVQIEAVDFPGFVIFCQQHFMDDNFSVINCFNEMIESLLPRVGLQCIDSLEEFLTMIITPLSDQRRSVRILVVNLMLLYVETSQSLELVKALLPFFSDQPNLAKTEILDFSTQAIERFRPDEDLYAEIRDVIKNAFETTSISIQNAASRLLNSICTICPDFTTTIPSSTISLLPEDDQKLLNATRAPAKPLVARLSKPVRVSNPRSKNIIFRPRPGKMGPHAARPRLPPMQAHPEAPTPRLNSPEQALEDLRDKYKCQSQPGIHPPDRPRPPDTCERAKSPRAMNPRARRSMGAVAPPPVPKDPPARRKLPDDIESVSELLQDENWEVQNEVIIELIEAVQEKPEFITRNLRVLCFDLMTSVSSLRSALAETALTCLRDMASEFGEDMTPFFETILTHIMTLLSSTRQAIARLAADCVSVILINVDRNAALEFLAKDHSQRSPEVKEHLALCLDALCGDCYEPSQLIPTIAMLLMDQGDNTREHAAAALIQLKQKFEDLMENPCLEMLDPEKLQVIESVVNGS